MSQKAEEICGSYRRDEATNPENFAAALVTLLSDYPQSLIDYAADPRTGIAAAFPNGLPNIGQIKKWLDDTGAHRERLRRMQSEPRYQRIERPRLEPRPGDLANVFVPKTVPIYQRMIDLANSGEANPREYCFKNGWDGIFVSSAWLDLSGANARAVWPKSELKPLTDEQLRALYSKPGSSKEGA